MKRLMVVALLALSLGACAQIQNAYDTLSGAKVSPQAVIVAANAFNALKATATNYLRLPRCKTTGAPVICRSPQATKIIIPAVRAGTVARNNLEQFMREHPGELGPSGVYDALVASSNTLKGVFAQYRIGEK